MTLVTRICKNCGKEYEACRTAPSSPGVYRWQDVACSPECGAKYLTAVLQARNERGFGSLEERDGTTVVVIRDEPAQQAESAEQPAQQAAPAKATARRARKK